MKDGLGSVYSVYDVDVQTGDKRDFPVQMHYYQNNIDADILVEISQLTGSPSEQIREL